MTKKITHSGELNLNGFIIPCYVLEDGTRILSTTAMQKALGVIDNELNQRSSGRLNEILSSKVVKPYLSKDLDSSEYEPIPCLNGKQKISGYKAILLPDICEALLNARDSGQPLGIRQQTVVKQAELLIRGLAKVGIIALVDEVTGYQDVRVKDALQQILEKFLLDEAKKYEVTFPLELYRQWFRLNNWDWKPENAQKRPGVLGTWTNKYIYDRMAPGMLKELKKRSPKNDKGHKPYPYFSFLTNDIGEPRLREFFGGLIALAKASTSWRKYIEMVERAYPTFGDQTKLQFPEGD